MKIRKCFVSNSSSASFIVIVKEYSFDKRISERKISEDMESILLNYGFKYMKGYPTVLLTYPEEKLDDTSKFNEKDDMTLYFDVTCNEQDVQEFLFKNKIPFMASIQNNIYLQVYDGKSDYYEIFTNYAEYYLIYRNWKCSAFELFKYKKPYYKEKINGDSDNNLLLGGKILDFQNQLEEYGKEASEFFTKDELNKINEFVYKIMYKKFEKRKDNINKYYKESDDENS